MSDEQTKRRGRGPGKKPAKVHVTMRVPAHVYQYFYGNTATMREVLESYVRDNPRPVDNMCIEP